MLAITGSTQLPMESNPSWGMLLRSSPLIKLLCPL